MKKIIFMLFLLLGVFPTLEKGELIICGTNEARAQIYGGELNEVVVTAPRFEPEMVPIKEFGPSMDVEPEPVNLNEPFLTEYIGGEHFGEVSPDQNKTEKEVDKSKADKSLKNGKLPPNKTKDTQVGSTCVFKTMEWILKYFGGTKTVGAILAEYANKTSTSSESPVLRAINLSLNGVPLTELNKLVNVFFESTPTKSITNSIDNGHPLMAMIKTGQTSIYHQVMITGYNNDGSVQYFDPQTGEYDTKQPAEFTNPITITYPK